MSNILVKTMMTLCRYKGTYLEEGISCCITVLFLWGIKELLLRKSRGERGKLPLPYLMFFMLLGIANSFILALFQHMVEEHGKPAYQVMFLFVVLGMFFEMAMVLVLAVWNDVYKEKNRLNAEYLRWQEEHYTYLEKREHETKKFRHDIRKHIFAIDALCKKGKTEEAVQYIGSIWGKLDSMSMNISVNHGIADAIFNQYADVCAGEDISLEVKGHMPKGCRIEAFDLCTVFSNMLSNAVEAVRESTKREIYLEIRYDEDTLLVYMKNDFMGERDIQDGRCLSQKEDRNRHGYGMLNIEECVEKYHGTTEYWTEDGKFISMIAMKYNM